MRDRARRVRATSSNIREPASCWIAATGRLRTSGRSPIRSTLDAVFVTHEHVDHFADVYSLQALLRYAPSGPVGPLPLYVPHGVFERMGAVLSGRGRLELAEAFDVHELVHDTPLEVGPLTIRPMLVDHSRLTFAVRVTSDVGTVCYTSDTAFGQRALMAARGCDLLLAEATLPERYADKAPHMTATQAAQLALDAGVRELVLTHVWPTNDRSQMLAEAQEVFGGAVVLACELDTYTIGSDSDRT